jgi:hypothetical protein
MFTVTDDEISRVFTALPCLSCAHWRSDRVKAEIGRIYLAVEAGETLSALPAREQLLRGCCKMPDEGTSITFLKAADVGW